MSDDAAVVVGVLGLIVAMVVLILVQQRRREARLATLAELEIPILSTWRSALIILPSMVAAPVLMAVLGALTHPGPEHAVAYVLLTIGLGVCGIFVGMKLSRRFARIGRLRYAPPHLELEVRAERSHVDLDQHCSLAEACAEGPSGLRLQVVAVRQGDQVLAFSYALTIGRKPYGGEHVVDRPVQPVLDSDARVIHDRIRQRFPSDEA